MIAALSVCHKDRQNALNLFRWIGELGSCAEHSLILSPTRLMGVSGGHAEIEEEAKKHFKEVAVFIPDDEDERGWPHSPNHAWSRMVIYVRYRVQKPFLWLEPDCVPLRDKWMDVIEAEYTGAGKPILAAEVLKPVHRASGIAVYPPKVTGMLARRILPQLDQVSEAWDSFFAAEFEPHVHFTRLIQNVWNVSDDPANPIAPTFPDSASLSLLDSSAVLFHRCKDGSLIERLREQRGLPSSRHGAQGEATPGPFMPSETPRRTPAVNHVDADKLQARIAELEAELARKVGKPSRKKKRSAPEQTAIDARMAKVRAARKKAVAA